ncbi:MAG: sugar ABC transporter substrate-binding protein [Bacteroidetes bacterium]|nr:sugar ABC transporter substrate-binding protein [Bacteroidota bacterium]
MKKLLFLVICFTMISGVFLFAGGEKEEAKVEVTTVTVMTWNSGYNLEVDQVLVEKFQEANPSIKVELMSVPQGFDDKVLTSHAAKNTPDGFLMWNTPQFVEAGVAEDLTPYIERDNIDMDRYHPVTKLWAEYKGGIYGLPKDYTPRAIYYNKNVFDEAGIAYPKDGWTFADFKDTVKKLTNGKSGADARYGYVAIPGHTYAMQGYIWSNGGDLVSADGMTASGYIDSKEVVEVVQWYRELYEMSITTSTMDAYQNLGQTEFQTGIVGMMDNGSWPISVFKDDTSLNFGIVAPPVPRAGMKPSPVIHSSTYSMFTYAKNKEAVWEYMKFVGGPEGMRLIEETKYSIGAIPSVTETSGLAEEPYLGDFYRISLDADMAPVFTRNPKWFEADGEFSTALERIFITGADIQSTLTEAARKMDTILQGKN